MDEAWKDLIYQSRNYGERFEISTDGKIGNKLTGTILKLTVNRQGYLSVCVSLGSKSNLKLLKLHKVIAETFIENTENKPIINHKDGNKLNNSLENLEWCTYKENSQHALKMGLLVVRKGFECSRSKLTREDVIFIRNNYKPRDNKYGSRALGRKFGIDHMQILKVVNNITYGSLV